MRFNNFNEAKDFLYSHTKAKKYDLEKITFLMREMGDFYTRIPVIHVVGTNGKGSVSSTLAAILGNAGYRTGLFTSPHLVNIRERVALDGKWISENDFCSAVSEVSLYADRMYAKCGEYPTFFELMYATAMLFFFNSRIDVAVLEAGLGGRLDATNVSNPVLTVITRIAFDHPKTLGNTMRKIAAEKAAVIRCKSHVVTSPQRKDILELIAGTAEQRDSKLVCATEKSRRMEIFFDQGRFFQRAEFKEVGPIDMALVGKHQIENASTVMEAVSVLRKIGYRIGQEAILKGFRRNRWPGRLEYLEASGLKAEFREGVKGIIFDGAHNSNGMLALRKAMKSMGIGKIPVICGVLGDKGPEKMHKSLKEFSEKLYITRPDSPRSIPAPDLAARFVKTGLHVEYSDDDPLKVFDRARSSNTGSGDILICGSLYLIGDYKKLLCDRISDTLWINQEEV